MDFEGDREEVTGRPAVIWEPVEPARARCNYWVKSADRRFAKGFARVLAECGIIASEWAALRRVIQTAMVVARGVGQSNWHEQRRGVETGQPPGEKRARR